MPLKPSLKIVRGFYSVLNISKIVLNYPRLCLCYCYSNTIKNIPKRASSFYKCPKCLFRLVMWWPYKYLIIITKASFILKLISTFVPTFANCQIAIAVFLSNLVFNSFWYFPWFYRTLAMLLANLELELNFW